MFNNVPMAPPDAILGLTEAFNADPNPSKINLSVGVYKNVDGITPVLPSVKQAEQQILAHETSKGYLPINGASDFAKAVQQLIFGEVHPLLEAGRVVTAHTPGGTGALRIAGEYLRKMHKDVTLWVSDPTWANHQGVFTDAGLKIDSYPYFSEQTHQLQFDAMMAALKQIPAGDVVLLHGAGHNPTGMDPTKDQWRRIAKLLHERGILPLVDFAYHGFGDGLFEDAMGIRALVDVCDELIVCVSFSKNFSLYNERVGALHVVAGKPDAAQAVLSQIKKCIRTTYSNPPAHGGKIVTTILTDPQLRSVWEEDLKQMRDHINGIRALLCRKLLEADVPGQWECLIRQRGMFSLTGLTKAQVEQLRQDYSIYVVGSGRINVAGITEQNVDRLVDAMKTVIAG